VALPRTACRPGIRDWIATAIQAGFAIWLLFLLVVAPWDQGAVAALVTLMLVGGISVLIYRRAIAPRIQRHFFGYGSRRRCIDPLARITPRLPSITRWRDPEWAAIQSVRNMPKELYYQTPQWRQRRELKLEEAGRKCQQCGGTMVLQAHHLTYDRLGHEKRSDLRVLCCACHGRIHHKNLCAFGRS
jgi:hypothetical protein